MKLGLREKLFVFSLFLIIVVGLIAGFFLEHQRRSSIEARIEGELVTIAQLAREQFNDGHVHSAEEFVCAYTLLHLRNLIQLCEK